MNSTPHNRLRRWAWLTPLCIAIIFAILNALTPQRPTDRSPTAAASIRVAPTPVPAINPSKISAIALPKISVPLMTIPQAAARTKIPALSFALPPGKLKLRDTAKAPDERVTMLVQLSEASALDAHLLARTTARDAASVKTLTTAAVSAQLAKIDKAQDALIAALTQAPIDAKVVYRVKRVLNAVAVSVPKGQVAAIRAIAGVKSVHLIQLEYPTAAKDKPDNSISVPFLGTPQVWSSLGVLGTGIKVGIIDTGLDYQHPNFGGSGLLADYQANDVTQAPNAFFPSAKVPGGVDFAGDAYDGTNTPVPDANPMDRNGHGTHVAGILAGYGVKPDGTTYSGPYTPTASETFLTSLRIGPGMAPGALLYPIRVFGTSGGTNLTVLGIEWAIDPNGDFDFSDHMDIVNLSLGSSYGSLADTSAMAAESAARLGIVMCVAAGNDGDTYFITGSPGVADGAITVASSIDSRRAAAVLQINSPATIAGNIGCAVSAFGNSAPAPTGQTGNIVAAIPAIANTQLTNAVAIAGNIALIDRGTNNFQNKVANAQAAGAIGAIVVNNVDDDPTLITMSASAGEPNIVIPSIYISKADGDLLKAQLPTVVNATLVASNSADMLSTFSSRGPQSGSPLHLKPDIAAPGQSIVSSQTGIVGTTGSLVTNPTGFIPGGQALTLSGTSMATPCVAGMMALLRQIHPNYSVEQLKALAMNNAIHDLATGANGSGLIYGPARVGSGRADPVLAAANNVIVYNADDAGAVSVSFGNVEVLNSVTQTKKVRVENHGLSDVTFSLDFTLTVTTPGAGFSTPGGSSITVPANQSSEFSIQFNADATQMKHSRDATVVPYQASPTPLNSFGNLNRHWISEHAGYLNFKSGGQTLMRVPVYAASHPVSAMAGPTSIDTSGGPAGVSTLILSGTGIKTGASVPVDIHSLVSPFELQVVHPLNPQSAPVEANLKCAGVAYDPVRDLILFGLVTHGSWNSPTQTSFQIFVDSDNDGVFDHVLFDGNTGSIASGVFGTTTSGTDVFINAVIDTNSNVTIGGSGIFVNADPGSVGSELMNSNVRILAASPAQLGLASGVTKFSYAIATGPGQLPLSELINGFDYDEAVGPYTWDYAAQGLNFGGTILTDDSDGSSLPVTYNLANLAANGSLGALLIHHHNAAGTRAQVIPLQGVAQGTDISVTQSATTLTPSLNQPFTITLTAANMGASDATSIVVGHTLSSNLLYVSDDGNGAYDPTTGVWTVGDLAMGATASLQIQVEAQNDTAASSAASLASGIPLDVNAANDFSTLALTPLSAADLRLVAQIDMPAVLAGNAVSCTFTLNNGGPSTARAIQTTIKIPAFPQVKFGSFVVSDGTFDVATGIWSIDSLGTGLFPTLTVTFNAPNFAAPLEITGSSFGSTIEVNSIDNTARASTLITSPAVISGTETVAGTFAPGSAVTYTIILTNTSNFDQLDNAGHECVDILPPDVSLLLASATSGAVAAHIANNTVTWDGVIPAHGVVNISIVAQLHLETEGATIANQATINYDADGDGSNEAVALTDDPTLPGLADPTTFTVPFPVPVFPSVLAATPNPAIVDVAVLFSAVVDPLSSLVSWNFGDGTAGTTGDTVQHIFTTEGTFTVTATATNPTFGTTAVATIAVVVGHATVLPNSIPISTTRGRLSFGKKSDVVAIVSTLIGPPRAVPGPVRTAGINGSITVGGLVETFVLDGHGSAKLPDGRVRVRFAPGKVNKISVSASFAGQLKKSVSAGVALNVSGLPTLLPQSIQLGTSTYSVVVPLTFKRSAAGNSARFSLR